MVSVNLVANTDLETPEEFRQLVVKEAGGTVVRLGEIADVVLGAENYEQDVRFNGADRDLHGRSGCCPTANTLDVDRPACATAMPEIQAQLPAGHDGRHPLRLDGLHRATRSTRCSRP